MQAAEGTVRITDPRAIRALAHPARMTVLERLFGGETLTATQCAQIAGLTPSAMSYHLRSLQRWGLVTRADPTGDARERPWRATGTNLHIEGEGIGARAAESVLAASLLEELRADVLSMLETSGLPTDDGRPRGAFGRWAAALTPGEFDELSAQLEALVTRYSDRPAAEGSRQYHLWWIAGPVEGGEALPHH